MIVICRFSSFRLIKVIWVNPNLPYFHSDSNKEKSKEFKTFADANGFCNSLVKKGMNCKVEYLF